jgi:hypothetical protein
MGQEKACDERIDGNNILSSRSCGEFQSEHSKAKSRVDYGDCWRPCSQSGALDIRSITCSIYR